MKKSDKEREIEQILNEIDSSAIQEDNTIELLTKKNIKDNELKENIKLSNNEGEDKLPEENQDSKERKNQTNKKSKNSISIKLNLKNDLVTNFSISDFTVNKTEIPSTVKVELLFYVSKYKYKITLTNLILGNLAIYLRTVTSPKNVNYNNNNIHLNSSYTNKDEVCSFCSGRSKIILKVTDLNGKKTKIYLCKNCFEKLKNTILKVNGYLNGELILDKYEKINSKHQNLIEHFKIISTKNRNYKAEIKKLNELKNKPNKNQEENLIKENNELYLKIDELQRDLAVYNRMFNKIDKLKNDIGKINEISVLLKKIFKDVIK